MTTRDQPAAVAEAIRRLPPATILKLADQCDGHTIFETKVMIDAGLPQEVAEALTHTYRSDRRSPKTMIFAGGKAVPWMRGIYGLDLLHLLADTLNVSYRECYGRGSQAVAIREALHKHFEQQ